MSVVSAQRDKIVLRCWRAGLVLLLTAWASGVAPAQTDPSPSTSAAPAPAAGASVPDSGIVQTGCSSCGAMPPPVYNHADDCGCGCGPCKGCGCIPGQPKCYCECCGEANNFCTKFLYGVYNCICCPDPCYEPHWSALADCAFFQDSARPVTQMKLIWDEAWHFDNPDRAEYFWARERTSPAQAGPGGPCAVTGFGKGPAAIVKDLNYDSFSLYTEAAQGAAGIFIQIPYMHTSPVAGPANATIATNPQPANQQQQNLLTNGIPPGLPAAMNTQAMNFLNTPGMPGMGTCPESGFGDMTIGTKAMLLDCCCLQATFIFRTTLPTGDFTKGLGTGHVSLEPSLVFGVPIAQDWFLQIQQAYWIPIGGDPLYEANIYHGHYALNHELWCPCPGLRLVGTLEMNHWVVFTGAYTDPDITISLPSLNSGKPTPVAQPAGASIISVGPGIRFVICDKIDFGVGSAFAVTGPRWASEEMRAEFRWRF